MDSEIERVVIVGNGMAGQSALEEIVRVRSEKYNALDVVVFGREPNHSYNRIMLSDVLSGKRTLSQLYTKKRKWYEENDIQLFTGAPVTEIDKKNRRVYADNGFSSPYDKLLIATGSNPFIPPLKGRDKKGVYAYRTIEDVWWMYEEARYKKRAAVIGGGLLGLEAAKALHDHGMQVTVVHLLDTLMEQQLDFDSSLILRQQMEKMGIEFVMEGATEEILGDSSVTGLKLGDGRKIDTDIVVICTGIRPNAELARKSGIKVNKGIVVNDFMETSEEGIFSVGECVEHRGNLYGLFDPLVEQARVAADSMIGDGEKIYEGSLVSAVLKVAGINLVSVGDFNGDKDSEDLIFSDPESGLYKKIVLKNNRVMGAIFLGDIKDYRRIFNHIKNDEEITCSREELLFGQKSEKKSETETGDIDEDDIFAEVNLVPENADYMREELHPRAKGTPWLGKVNAREIKNNGMEVNFDRYRKEGFSAIVKDDFLRLKTHGYCSQKQDGYFMRRIRIPGGTISVPQLDCVSALAEKYGGWLHITTRQALELHWTKIDSEDIDEALKGVGLSTRSACGHAIRNVACCEVAGIDPDEVMDVRPWVKATHDYIVNNSLLINKRLPRKMNIYFANSGKYRSHALVNDLGFVAVSARQNGYMISGFEVWVAGSLGSKPHLGHKLLDFIPPEETLAVLSTIIDLYARHGENTGSKNPRLKALVEDWGYECFREEFLALYHAKHPPFRDLEIDSADNERHEDVDIEGVYKQKQEGYYRVVVRVPLGEMTSEQAKSISGLSLKYGDGRVQMTMQQNLEFHWVREENLEKLISGLGRIGLAPRGSQSILDVQSCPGTTFCVWGVSNSQGTGDSLIKHIDDAGYMDDEQISKLRINISGCPNSCAQHQVADIGFSGSAGKYFMYLGGHMNGDARVGEIARKNILPEEVNETVDAVLDMYLEEREENEIFADFINRTGIGEISERLARMLDTEEAVNAREEKAKESAKRSPDQLREVYTVKFKQSGKTIKVKGNETILQKGLDEGLSLPFSCQQGICGTCKVRVKGKFEQGDADAIDSEEIASGEALICTAKPRGNMEVDA